MADLAAGAEEFAALARRLKEAGEVTLRRELYRAISDAAQPVAHEIDSYDYLAAYMPDRYAAVLAPELSVTVSRLTSERNPAVRLVARTRHHRRKVTRLDAGLINHPVYPEHGTPRKTWHWRPIWPAGQTRGMRPGFFTGAARRSAPEIRDEIRGAMRRVADKAARRI